MKIEKQVVSLKPAEEMAELGFKQDSIWVWMKAPRTGNIEVVLRLTMGLLEDQKWKLVCAAYTVAEVGEILPDRILHGVMPTPYDLSIEKFVYDKDVEWRVKYRNESICDTFYFVKADSEADARAKMCIWLREEGLI